MEDKDLEAYEYAKKAYEAKLKRRGPEDPSTKEWKVKMQLLAPKDGGAKEGKKKKSDTLKKLMLDEEVVMPTNIEGSY